MSRQVAATRSRLRSLSSGSMTPMEDEDEAPKRSTRGRNPLPPTSGPLFPPLPPKVPKTKASKSPNHTASGSGSQHQSQMDEVEDAEAAGADEAAHVPSGSGGSLSPPPEGDVEGTPRQRRSGKVSPQTIDIKLEDEASPANANGNGHARRYSSHLAPPDSAGDESDASNRRKNRRRRGEDQLLFDDHLLPEELRQTGKLIGKRARESYTSATSDGNWSTKRRNSSIKRDEEAVADDEDDTQERSAVPDAEEQGEAEAGRDDDADISEPPPEDPELPAADAENIEEVADAVGEADVENEEAEDEGDGDEEGGGEEITRCVCQREDGDPLMISCETCMVWQHMPCIGIWSNPESPDEYFCEKCRPDLHGPLKKWIRSRGRNIENFLPPTPEDLKALHSPHDKYPPSQSKRWLSGPASKKGKSDKGKEKEKEKVKEEKVEKVRSKDASPERRKSIAGRDTKEATLPLRDKPESGRHSSRRPSSHGPPSHGAAQKPVSIMVDAPSPPSMRDSQSPMTFAREPKRRSTMNSRDAAIEEEDLRRAMEESRREMKDGEEGQQEEGTQEETVQPVEEEEKEELPKEKGKGKVPRREEEPAPNKPKHPNQYTYRPRPAGPIPTPARRGGQGGTPVPSLGPAMHDHGTRRAGALANGAREAPFIAVQSDGLGWNIPDHLAQHIPLLPSANPVLLSVRSPRPMANLAKSHFLNYRYGPFEEKRDAKGRLIMPTDGPEREVVGEKGEKHTENPAKPRWPPRRMTAVEMRKRVRGMLEYVGKVQLDEEKRAQRRREMGIAEYVYEGTEKRRRLTPVEQEEAVDEGKSAGIGESTSMSGVATEQPTESITDEAEISPPAKSMSTGPPLSQLLADIMSELVEFEDTWMRPGASGPTGTVSSSAMAAAKSICNLPALPMATREHAPAESGPSTATSGTDNGEVGEPASAVPSNGETPEQEPTPEGVQEAGGAMEDETAEQMELGDEGVSTFDATATGTEPVEATDEPAEPLASDSHAEGETATVDPTPIEAAEASPPGMTSEKLTDPVEVYREGQVDVVVARPEENAAADLIEREAASTLGDESEERAAEGEQTALGAIPATEAPGEETTAHDEGPLADPADMDAAEVEEPPATTATQPSPDALPTSDLAASAPAPVLPTQSPQIAPIPSDPTSAVDTSFAPASDFAQPIPNFDLSASAPSSVPAPLDFSLEPGSALDFDMDLDAPQLTDAEVAELINMPIDDNLFAGMPGLGGDQVSAVPLPDLAAGAPVQPIDQPGSSLDPAIAAVAQIAPIQAMDGIAHPDMLSQSILGGEGAAEVNSLDMISDADLTAMLASADNAADMPGFDDIDMAQYMADPASFIPAGEAMPINADPTVGEPSLAGDIEMGE